MCVCVRVRVRVCGTCMLPTLLRLQALHGIQLSTLCTPALSHRTFVATINFFDSERARGRQIEC